MSTEIRQKSKKFILALVFLRGTCYNVVMKVDLSVFSKGARVAVAVSGGSDSMALLHYLFSHSNDLQISVCALNIEHGIRGEQSKRDSLFVKEYCEANSIPFIFYAVDSINYSKTNKLCLEESARKLRYECFYDAINGGKCDCVATAHHLRDNAESVLFNLFRGTGTSGVSGINSSVDGKIIRPLLGVSKSQIDAYVKENDLPFVVDQTNFDTDYSRNYIRQTVLPAVEKSFPDAEKSIYRFSRIAKKESDYLNSLAKKFVTDFPRVEITLPLDSVLFNRACIIALKKVGITKDWEQVHLEGLEKLARSQTNAKFSLPKNTVAIKEYNKIVFYKTAGEKCLEEKPFIMGETEFNGRTVCVEKVVSPNLKDDFYGDASKISSSAVIRTRRNGDVFTKFGGGTKKLNDFLTDKKIPTLVRDDLIVLADGKNVLVVFGIAVSNDIAVEKNSNCVLKFHIK